jgi:hypothetical protein
LDNGKYNYRLKQVDFNGRYQFSEIVEVEFKVFNSYNLEQNYPNPFNPTTHFEFRIADFGFVSLKIFDVLGNEVATLVDEEKAAGSYEVEFSATGGYSSGGNAYNLPSGIYFYILQSGNYIETKKMMLLK